jgi:hypothetical protein
LIQPGSKPYIHNKRKKKALGPIIIPSQHERMMKEWHVDDILLFSDHQIVKVKIRYILAPKETSEGYKEKQLKHP